MEERVYNELQSWLNYKLANNPYTSSWKTEEAYENTILSVKSKLNEIKRRGENKGVNIE